MIPIFFQALDLKYTLRSQSGFKMLFYVIIYFQKKQWIYRECLIVQHMNAWRVNRQFKAVFIWAPMECRQSGLSRQLHNSIRAFYGCRSHVGRQLGSIKELVQILDFIHVRFFLNRVGRLLVLIFFLIFHEEDASRFTCYSSIR